jgi:predicted RNase H-like HicB family nuclease
MNEEQLAQATKLASRNYNIIISHDRLSDGSIMYMVRNPELEGCKAQGRTQMEAISNLRDARIDYIYYLLEDGIDVPVPNSQNVTGSQAVTSPTIVFESSPTVEDVIDTVIRPDEREDLLETWSTSEPVKN